MLHYLVVDGGHPLIKPLHLVVYLHARRRPVLEQALQVYYLRPGLVHSHLHLSLRRLGVLLLVARLLEGVGRAGRFLHVRNFQRKLQNHRNLLHALVRLVVDVDGLSGPLVLLFPPPAWIPRERPVHLIELVGEGGDLVLLAGLELRELEAVRLVHLLPTLVEVLLELVYQLLALVVQLLLLEVGQLQLLAEALDLGVEIVVGHVIIIFLLCGGWKVV